MNFTIGMASGFINIMIMAVLLGSCNAINPVISISRSIVTGNDYILVIKLRDEGNNYYQIINTLNKTPVMIREDGIPFNLRYPVIRVLYAQYKDMGNYQMKLLSEELWKCAGIIEINETAIRN